MAKITANEKSADAGWSVSPLTPPDLDAVVEIDREIAGHPRRKFFEQRLAAALAEPARYVYVAARQDGKLAGYALARIADGEFGVGARAATLDALGVAKASWGKGAGRRLLEAVEAVLKHKGVGEIVTEVDWGEQGMLHFFEHGGFEIAPRVVLSRDTATPLNF